MSRRSSSLAVIGILIVLGVRGSSTAHDRVVVQEWVGPSGEARCATFLAAERFAERMGWKVRELRSLPELDTLPADGC